MTTEPTDDEILEAVKHLGAAMLSPVEVARAVLQRWGQPAGRDPEFDQFLYDVMTAAGLVAHGKQCKQLGERLGAAVLKLLTHDIKAKEAKNAE